MTTRRSGTWRLGGSARGLLVPLLLVGSPAGAVELTVHLVPESEFAADRITPETFLTEGEILLYRTGTYAPALRSPLNEPLAIPPGEWTWIGEAPGFVTASAGVLTVREGEERAVRLVWPAVPACRIAAREGEDFRRLRRLDVVSLDRGATYPLLPGERPAAWVPAGRFLAYGVGARGLEGIARPSRCGAGQRLEIEAPSPPPRDLQDLLLPITLPEDVDRSELMAVLTGDGGGPLSTLLPTVAAWSPGRATLFFLGAPAGREARLRLEHPLLRTAQRTFEPRPGEARELAAVALRRRPGLEVTLDYRPKRPHRTEELRLYRCGDRTTVDPSLDARACLELPERLALEAGVGTYTFRALDEGQYQIDAWIDDERVPGAGHALRPYLGADDSGFEPLGPLPLWELEIYGHLLRDGEPVAGTVVIGEPGLGPSRRFPTGDDGYYRLTYFGNAANRYDLRAAGIEESALERPSEERLGLFHRPLRACDAGGACRGFHLDSTLIGEGRLDLDLGPPRTIEVTVRDRSTGEPIERAFVGYRPADRELHFAHGEVRWAEPGDAHPSGGTTGADGKARLRALPAGTLRLGASAEGYRPAGIEVEVPEGEVLQTTLELMPDLEEGGSKIALGDGTPLTGATVLIFDEDRWDRRCSRAADPEGRVDFPSGCLSGRTALVLHPRAAISPLPGETFAAAAEIELDPAPDPPLVVRVEDTEGRPVARVPLVLGWNGIHLGPDQFVFAARHLSSLYPRTDDRGEAALPGVDPSAPVTPTVAVAGRPGGAIALDGASEAEPVILTFDP